ncbi:MFS transporter [Caulobacter mirabilis]|uniref:MFS transporter n=1 Tax=Caulobacter mirabilis TaxID=69666 RepID=A0A2D2B1W7_9CAUL|nr:MFS transporter [Caulobacter mirabilis]ATQ44259.1 MFS transporter [Caulobacter mirabilis]
MTPPVQDAAVETLDRASALAPTTEAQPWLLAVLSIAVGTFVLVTSEFLPVGLLTDIAASLKVTEGAAGLSVTVPGLVAAVAAPLIAIGAGSLDRRALLLGLIALLVGSNLISTFATSLEMLVAGRTLMGVAVGGFWAMAGALGMRLAGEAKGPRAVAIIFAGVSVGTVCGVPAGSLIGELAGWRAAFGIAAGVAVLALVAQLIFLPPMPQNQKTTARNLIAPFAVPKARLGLLAALFLAGGHFASYTYVQPFLQQVSHMNAGQITGLLLLFGAGGLVGNFLGGLALEKSVRATKVVMALSMGSAVLGLAAFGGDQLAASIAIAFWGLAFGAMPICIQTWMFKAAPEAMETSGALLVTTFQVALASGALLGGLLVDHVGVTQAMIVGGSASLFTAFLIWTFGGDRKVPARPPHE